MAAGRDLIYSVDTSALIDGLERYYPEQSFPSLWRKVDELIEESRFLVSEEVCEEVRARDATVKAWLDTRIDRVTVRTDAAVASEVRRILLTNKRLVMNLKNRNRADPFVIAVASLRSAAVVTGEGNDGTQNRPKIPYVCGQLGLQCIRFLDLIKNEGWRFD